MFFIGGAGNGSKDLGRRTNQVCPGCGSRLGMQLIRTNGYIHLFFVPVFRYDIHYFLSARTAERPMKSPGRTVVGWNASLTSPCRRIV